MHVPRARFEESARGPDFSTETYTPVWHAPSSETLPRNASSRRLVSTIPTLFLTSLGIVVTLACNAAQRDRVHVPSVVEYRQQRLAYPG